MKNTLNESVSTLQCMSKGTIEKIENSEIKISIFDESKIVKKYSVDTDGSAKNPIIATTLLTASTGLAIHKVQGELDDSPVTVQFFQALSALLSKSLEVVDLELERLGSKGVRVGNGDEFEPKEPKIDESETKESEPTLEELKAEAEKLMNEAGLSGLEKAVLKEMFGVGD